MGAFATPQDDKPVRPGGSQIPARPNTQSNMGIGPENFESVFVRHRHDGTISGGAVLFGPYFLKDANGQAWKLVVSTIGAITAVKA